MPGIDACSERGPHTWEDFIALEEDDLRELIDGELVEIEMPTNFHERIVALLIYFLESWSNAHDDAGMVFGSGYKVRISKRRGLMPDVQFFQKGNLPRGQVQGLVEGHPDLVIEVISPSSVRYDRVTKLQWYAELGVFDPKSHTVERLVLQGAHYLIADSLAGDATFAPASFEGLEVPLAKLWRAADDLAAPE